VATPVKTSSFSLPGSKRVDVVFVELPGGSIVPRRVDEVLARPTPPPARK
jgi:hypothetical protein